MLNTIIEFAIAAVPALFAADLAIKTRKACKATSVAACKPLRPILNQVQFDNPAPPTPDPWDLPLEYDRESLVTDDLETPATQWLLEAGAIVPEVLESIEVYSAPVELPLVTIAVKATETVPLALPGKKTRAPRKPSETKAPRRTAAAVVEPKPKPAKGKAPKAPRPKAPKDTRTIAELKAACKDAGLKGYSKLNRAELIALLAQA